MKRKKNNFSISINQLPGFDQVGSYVKREDVHSFFPTRKAAENAAKDIADFGAPFIQQYCVHVSKKIRGRGRIRGRKILSQHNSEVWEE